ncbi:MAG: HPr family phosphocarrier protein [Clostridia bacterium]|nr:HPr family phosphocarrier protein [Clostridia bacterium]
MKSSIKAKADLTLALAKKVAECAAKCVSDIRVLAGNKSANAKSLMGVIALSYKKGADLILIAEGRDAAHAIEELKKLL